MKFAASASVLAICLPVLFLATSPAHAGAGPSIERLVSCQDSWLDWKDDDARTAKFAENLLVDYVPNQDEGYLAPKDTRTLFGLPVARVYPDSIGMAVGFSVVVDAGLDATRRAMEKALGKPFKCDDKSDEMQGCQFARGPKKTVTLMSDEANTRSTLVGCYYFYAK